ncbi:MAG: hypothetical protein ACI80V_000769 [Rhodothermales bacterium]|jgi:hypothetical protein
MSLRAPLLIAFTLLASCEPPNHDVQIDPTESVWAVDLINILPGGEEEYVGNIQNNWAQARDIALRTGDLVSFRALITRPDSTREWDLILMTEYADSGRWDDREAIFNRIFESAEYQHIPTARPGSELREFIESGVAFTSILREEKR